MNTVSAAIEIDKALNDAQSWEAADRAVQLVIEQAPPNAKGRYAELAASRMLDSFLLDGPMTTSKAAVVGRYTEMLIEADSPDAPLVLEALTALDGHWPPADLRLAARKAAAVADAFARDTCADCESGPSTELENERKRQERALAADQLRRLSRPS